MMRGQVLLPIRRPVPGRLRHVPASDQRRVRGPAPRRGHVALRVRGVHAAARGDALAGATRVYCHVTPVPPPQVILYLYDSYQLANDLGTSPQHWRPDMCRSAVAQVCHYEEEL